jgi:hypothetical protein
MRKILVTIPLLLLAYLSPAAHAGTDVRVIISGEIAPGVYGRVDYGNDRPPPVVYAQPMIILRQPQPVQVQPIYLHVPPGHAKNWSKHCGKYNACGTPVYFVRSAEYEPKKGKKEKKEKKEKHGHD